MKLELDLNSSQKTTLINNSENDLGAEDVKKMLRSGISLAKEGNRVEARQMLLNVTEADPNNETAWLWLASISEYPEELLVFLQNVLKVNPENERALEWAKQTKSLLSKTFVQRGINAAQSNQKEFAKQCFLQGIVHDGENEMAWLWLASTSESQEEKVSHLNKVLRINPENETALSSLNAVKSQMSQGLLKKANSAAVSGDHEAARQTLNAVMKSTPNLEEAWILKAFLATDFYEKIECYEKALELNPESEAAQAGLASLKLLMPKMPKPAVEEVKAEEVIEDVEVVEETKEEAAPVEEKVEEIVEETFAEPVQEFSSPEEQFVEEQFVAEEQVEYDEKFDLEQLAEEAPVETVSFEQEVVESVSFETQAEEFKQEEAQPESRAFAEEVYFERQQEEESIHETQTGVREDFSVEPVQEAPQTKVESIFNYEEVVNQEESLAEESQAEAVLEFAETSPTQELDEDFAHNAAAAFNVSVEENVAEEVEFKNELELSVEPAQQVVAETASELEDFYTEQSFESNEVSNEVVVEEPVYVEPKAEVEEAEVQNQAVKPAGIYNSEFFANDGFVVVPPENSFADYHKETVEFSYTETESQEEVAEPQQFEETAQIAETENYAQAEQHQETQQFVQQTEQVEQYVESNYEVSQPKVEQNAVAEHYQETFEQQSQAFVEAPVAEQYAQIEQPVEPQQFEQTAEPQYFAPETVVEETRYVEEVSQPVQHFEEDAQPVEYVEETAQTVEYRGEVSQVAEPQYFEPVAEVAHAEQVVQEVAEAPQVQLSQCPFCAAQNDSQAVVCGSCQAMLSLTDLEKLISHQGVQQDLLLHTIEKMEVEKSIRTFNAEELTYLAIAHLNAKNLQKGLEYLEAAAQLNPNDVILPAKIKFLTNYLEEHKSNKDGAIAVSRTILVVDDSPTVRKLISGKLEKCGHSVLSAVDGMDALAKINEVIPDLILLDITMPRLDGYQVCKLIRNNEMTKDVPIVMISGKDGFFDKVRGRMAGSTGYITKPFGPDTLMKTIESYLS